MRIALVWNLPYPFLESTAPYPQYVSGLTELGCHVQAFYQAGTEQGCPFGVETFRVAQPIVAEFRARSGG